MIGSAETRREAERLREVYGHLLGVELSAHAPERDRLWTRLEEARQRICRAEPDRQLTLDIEDGRDG